MREIHDHCSVSRSSRTDGAAFDESRFGKHGFAPMLAEVKLFDPLDGACDEEIGIPTDVENLRLVPVEGRVVILTNHRDVDVPD